VAAVVKHRAVHVLWSCNGNDKTTLDPEALLENYTRCTTQAQTSGVVAMNSISNVSMGAHPDVLRAYIQELKQAGYKFVLVEDYVKVSCLAHN
jgi:hypothetical protein